MITLCRRKRTLNVTTDDELFSLFCLDFPEYAAKFSRYKEMKPHFEGHLFSMLAKARISSGKVAHLLNRDLIDVRDKMREMGILRLW